MTLGIFLPAFVFPIFFHHQLIAIAESPVIRPFLLGVAAGVIGLIAAVTVQILEREHHGLDGAGHRRGFVRSFSIDTRAN